MHSLETIIAKNERAQAEWDAAHPEQAAARKAREASATRVENLKLRVEQRTQSGRGHAA